MGRKVRTTSRFGAWLRDTKLGLARLLGKLPDGPPAFPLLGDGVLLRGAPGAGTYFPQFIAADGARMDDAPGGGGFQLIDRRDTSTARLGPFGAQIAARLETH